MPGPLIWDSSNTVRLSLLKNLKRFQQENLISKGRGSKAQLLLDCAQEALQGQMWKGDNCSHGVWQQDLSLLYSELCVGGERCSECSDGDMRSRVITYDEKWSNHLWYWPVRTQRPYKRQVSQRESQIIYIGLLILTIPLITSLPSFIVSMVHNRNLFDAMELWFSQHEDHIK